MWRCCDRFCISGWPLKAFREDFAPLAAIEEYIRLKLEVSRDYPQASRLLHGDAGRRAVVNG